MSRCYLETAPNILVAEKKDFLKENRERFILHPINKSLKLREYWFNEEVPNYANKKTMGQQDKSENRHGRASGTQCR